MDRSAPLLRAPEIGEKIERWGESFIWTKDHPTEEALNPLLYSYDEIGANAYDRAMEFFAEEQKLRNKELGGAAPGKPVKPDVFKIVTEHANDPACAKLLEQAKTVPDWVDWKSVERGQLVFYRYAMANMVGLGFQSLFVGMAAARVIEVLSRTGGFSVAAAQKRGFETSQWILDVMKSLQSLQPGGEGWEATLRVRLLHSAVRSRIMAMAKERPEYFDIQAYGTPINDLHQIATIGSFSSAPIWYSLPRQKIQLRDQEIDDFIHLWRYISYLIGSPDEWFKDRKTAFHIQQSIMYIELHPNHNSKVLANNMLEAFRRDTPIKMPKGLIAASARHLAGDPLCDEWDIAKPNFVWRGLWNGQVSMYKGFAYMCRSVGWMDRGQIKMMRKMTYKLVVDSKFGLKGEKTNFALKYMPHFNLTKAE